MDRTRSYEPTALPATSGVSPGRVAEDLPERSKARYEFLGELARGGLGIVFEAIDCETGRRVAIKELLRPTAAAEARFCHEALVTARLEHPGIVPVYDVGRWQESAQLFYAMKLVSGRSLKEGIAEAPDLETRLGLLPRVVAACDAVAHAHARGVIHRDLKPGNVLLGDHGETVVIDWGLAKYTHGPAFADEGGHDGEEPAPGAVDDALTRTGAILGTPAYMPPEQASGTAIDERSDVYAIGAMLLHVLTGAPPARTPSEDDGATELAATFADGPPVPPELAAIVKRATAADPADRYQTAGELADELRRFSRGQLIQAHRYSRAELARRWVVRHRLGLLAAGLVLASALAIAGVQRARRADPAVACQVGDDELEGSWDSARRVAVTSALQSSGAPGAGRIAALTATTLDEYAADWRAMATDSCLATYDRRVQSERVFELRRRCLDRRRADLAALVTVLANAADASTALPAAQALPPIDYCANETALTSARPPPADPGDRARFDRALDDLATAKALEDTAKYAEGEALARRVLDAHPGPDFAAVRAMAALRLGWLRTYTGDYQAARESLLAAVELGSQSGDDDTVARAWSQAVFLTAQHLFRPDEARMLVPAARAAVVRAGSPPLVDAQLTLNVGTIAYVEYDFALARTHWARALEMFREAGGADFYKVAWGLNNLAIAENGLGNYEAAEAYIREALEFKSRLFGLQHPDVGLSRLNLGRLLYQTLRFREALDQIERTLAGYRAVFAEDSYRVAVGLYHKAATLCGLGRFDEASTALDAAGRTFDAIEGGANMMSAETRGVRAVCLARQRRFDEARDNLAAGIRLVEDTYGRDSRSLSRFFATQAALESVNGHRERAKNLAARAAEVGAPSATLEQREAHRRLKLVEGLVRLGFLDDALREIEQARADVADDDDVARQLVAWRGRIRSATAAVASGASD